MTKKALLRELIVLLVFSALILILKHTSGPPSDFTCSSRGDTRSAGAICDQLEDHGASTTP